MRTFVNGGWIRKMTVMAVIGALTLTVGAGPVLAGDNDGLVWGAILGGAAGGVIGHQSGHAGQGVLIGVLAGGLIGHLIDDSREKEEARYREEGKNYRRGLDPINSMAGAEFGMSVTEARNSLPRDLRTDWRRADDALDGDLVVYEAAKTGDDEYLFMFYRGKLFAMAQQKSMRQSAADRAYDNAVDQYGRPTNYYNDEVPTWYDYNTKGFMYIDQKYIGRSGREDLVQWVQFVTYQPTFDRVQPSARRERFVGDHFFREGVTN